MLPFLADYQYNRTVIEKYIWFVEPLCQGWTELKSVITNMSTVLWLRVLCSIPVNSRKHLTQLLFFFFASAWRPSVLQALNNIKNFTSTTIIWNHNERWIFFELSEMQLVQFNLQKTKSITATLSHPQIDYDRVKF